MNILYADADPQWRRRVGKAVSLCAHIVTSVATTERLLEALTESPGKYQVVIIDTFAPIGTTDFPVLAQLRGRFRDLPIIVVSDQNLTMEAKKHKATFAFKNEISIVNAVAAVLGLSEVVDSEEEDDPLESAMEPEEKPEPKPEPKRAPATVTSLTDWKKLQ